MSIKADVASIIGSEFNAGALALDSGSILLGAGTNTQSSSSEATQHVTPASTSVTSPLVDSVNVDVSAYEVASGTIMSIDKLYNGGAQGFSLFPLAPLPLREDSSQFLMSGYARTCGKPDKQSSDGARMGAARAQSMCMTAYRRCGMCAIRVTKNHEFMLEGQFFRTVLISHNRKVVLPLLLKIVIPDS